MNWSPVQAAVPRKPPQQIRRMLRHHCLLPICLLLGTAAVPAQFAITEFMAENNTSLNDEDGTNSDWIEIHNESAAAASLAGWSLTDDPGKPAKWRFPAVTMPPDGYLIVFASDKNRAVADRQLHTNFRLSSSGEYLALVGPDGITPATAFTPAYGPQVADVSHGSVRELSSVPLIAAGSNAHAFVPPDGSLALAWTDPGFTASAAWLSGTTGVGYDRQPIGVNFLPLIGLNVESVMYPANPSVYVRVPFHVTDPTVYAGLTLRLQYEDGFIAYLNGQEIARDNVPAAAAWNSLATAPRTDTAAVAARDFDVSAFRGSLRAGSNVLAFHAMNNPASSPDLLLVPILEGVTPSGPPALRYFTAPTPGAANRGGTAALGPLIRDAAYFPAQPGDADAITVTARIDPAFGPVASATLRYLVMFGSEVAVPFADDGLHGDGSAGDGVHGAIIPATAAAPGQMVRWSITTTDRDGRTSRHPSFLNPTESSQYLGTVISSPALSNPLPVFHWFVQNPSAASTTTGTRASVFWQGQFHDNVFCRVRGATAPGFSKKPYKFDFNPGDHFRFQPGAPRVDELNLNTTYQDKAYLRAPLVFEKYREAGVPGSDCFNVRVQQNNAFFSVAVFTEQVDTTFLQRRGLDPEGALYKMNNGITSSTAGVEKKTRRTESAADLESLVAGLNPSQPNRNAFLFDQFDMPAIVNYLAAGVVTQDFDRMVKNYYLYRDTNGTKLWRMLPWDKDLSLGLFGLQCDTVSGNDDSATYTNCAGGYISHPLVGTTSRNFVGHINYLLEAVYASTTAREMFLRRLRTLMDAQLQPPDTAAESLRFETRMAELIPILQPDATLDLAKWQGGFGAPQPLATATGAIRTNFLAQRRTHLYQRHHAANAGSYPASARIPGAQSPSPNLSFGRIESTPATGTQAHEFVELLNPLNEAVDVSGWTLDGPLRWTFRPGTVIPAGGSVFVTSDPVAFRSRPDGPRGGLGLLAVGPASGQLSARGGTLTLRHASGAMVTTTTYQGNPGSILTHLRISEVMFHTPDDDDPAEFIELSNTSPTVTLNLPGVRLTGVVDFVFPSGPLSSLAPGASAVVVKNPGGFALRYGNAITPAGAFSGTLDNDGGSLTLLDPTGQIVQSVTYSPRWLPITDGHGFSLVPLNVEETEPLPDTTGWRSSAAMLGSPGRKDPVPPLLPAVVINEILSRLDGAPGGEFIELANLGTVAADVSGWFLSDDFRVPAKFRIPAGSLIPPGGFLVVRGTEFNAGATGFGFGSDGDDAWLFSAEASGQLSGHVHGFAFGAAADGVSFGRHLDSTGHAHITPLSDRTPGALNASAMTGPVRITEIHYHPSSAQGSAAAVLTPLDILRNRHDAAISDAARKLEFLEIQNNSMQAVPLFDPLRPTSTWRLRGDADFDFPPGITLSSGGTLLVVNFDPATDPAAVASFRAAFGVSALVPLFGPFSGYLDNAGARVELQRPETLPGATAAIHIAADSVTYGKETPWPAAADGSGPSLQRLSAEPWSGDPANWSASAPTPGTGLPVAPLITAFSLAASTATVRCTSAIGYSYQVESSADLISWYPASALMSGTGREITSSIPVTPAHRFLRVARTR
jgi:hypothetical protein